MTTTKCATCDRVGVPCDFKRCAACKSEFYCDVGCQQRDWPRHRLFCTAATPRPEAKVPSPSNDNTHRNRDIARSFETVMGRLCAHTQFLISKLLSGTPRVLYLEYDGDESVNQDALVDMISAAVWHNHRHVASGKYSPESASQVLEAVKDSHSGPARVPGLSVRCLAISEQIARQIVRPGQESQLPAGEQGVLSFLVSVRLAGSSEAERFSLGFWLKPAATAEAANPFAVL